MPLINCDINPILIYSQKCVLSNDTETTTFETTGTNLYALAVTLSTQDHANLLQQLKSGFKRTINWNKYQSKVTLQAQNQYLDI